MRTQNNPAARRDQELFDERVPLIRWQRVAIGSGLVLIAILLIIVENHFGMVATPSARNPASASTPLLGTSISANGLLVNPALIGRSTSVDNVRAAPGTILLRIEVRLVNRGIRSTVIGPSDFSIVQSGKQVATPMHVLSDGSALRTQTLLSGAHAAGQLTFMVPVAHQDLSLALEHGTTTAAHRVLWQMGSI